MTADNERATGGIPEAGQVIADRYQVENIIGSGGMCAVVGARHLGLGQPVAIKFLFPEMLARPDIVARFFREARAMATLQGDHVPRVFDVSKLPNGAPYIVMEWLAGGDLEQIAGARGPLPVTDSVGWVLEACEAVAEAHKHGIVHRDLKTANLFLAQQPDGSAVVKVLDFGISKMADAGVALTGAATTLGSPAFISPEQIRSTKSVDPRTDVWAMGVILYRLLTAGYPFEGERVSEVLGQVLTAPPVPVHTRRPDIPPALEAVIMRCLEKELDRRTPDVAELALALRPFGPPRGHASVDHVFRVLRGAPAPAAAPTPSAAPTPAPAPAPAAAKHPSTMAMPVMDVPPSPVANRAPPAPAASKAALLQSTLPLHEHLAMEGAAGLASPVSPSALAGMKGGQPPGANPPPGAANAGFAPGAPSAGSMPVAATGPTASAALATGKTAARPQGSGRWLAVVTVIVALVVIAAGIVISRLVQGDADTPGGAPSSTSRPAPEGTGKKR